MQDTDMTSNQHSHRLSARIIACTNYHQAEHKSAHQSHTCLDTWPWNVVSEGCPNYALETNTRGSAGTAAIVKAVKQFQFFSIRDYTWEAEYWIWHE